MTESLFPWIQDVVAPEPRPTPAAKLSERREALMAAGYHPLANVLPRLRLKANPGAARCGNCAHITRIARNRDYLKCDLHPSHSEASDVRLKWPACEHWTVVPGTIPG